MQRASILLIAMVLLGSILSASAHAQPARDYTVQWRMVPTPEGVLIDWHITPVPPRLLLVAIDEEGAPRTIATLTGTSYTAGAQTLDRTPPTNGYYTLIAKDEYGGQFWRDDPHPYHPGNYPPFIHFPIVYIE